MPKTLLLISSLADDLAFAKSAAATAELPFELAPSPAEAVEAIETERAAVVLCDTSNEERYAALEKTIQESVGLFSDKVDANQFHFLSAQNLEHVQYLVNSPLFGHFIMRNYGDPVQAGVVYGRVLRATQERRAFGLGQLLKPGTKIQTVKLISSTQKQGAVEAIKNYLLAAKFQSRMATVIANAVDELLMNAIFDAPVDDLGRPRFATTSRATAMQLGGRNAVELQIGFDGSYVGVTAVDLFGSLDKVKLLSHISKIYTEEEYKVKTTVAGAGIGLATVFRSGGSFFFVSEASARTEVTVFFKRTDSFRDFKDQFRFLSTQFYF